MYIKIPNYKPVGINDFLEKQRKESKETNNHKTILVIKHVVFLIGIELKHLFYIVKLQIFVHLCDRLQLFLYFYKLNLIIQEIVYRN